MATVRVTYENGRVGMYHRYREETPANVGYTPIEDVFTITFISSLYGRITLDVQREDLVHILRYYEMYGGAKRAGTMERGGKHEGTEVRDNEGTGIRLRRLPDGSFGVDEESKVRGRGDAETAGEARVNVADPGGLRSSGVSGKKGYYPGQVETVEERARKARWWSGILSGLGGWYRR